MENPVGGPSRQQSYVSALEDGRKGSRGPWVLRAQVMASCPLSLPLRKAKAERAPTGAATEQLAMAPMDVSRIQPHLSHLTLHSI